MLLTLKDASLAYGHVPLLDRTELLIDSGEHVALIGRNGTGKSSLLQVLAGATRLDKGELWIAPNARVALVPQEPAFDADLSVFDAVAEGVGVASRMLSAYHRTTDRLAHATDAAEIDSLSDEMAKLQAGIDREGAWVLEHRIEATLSTLQLDGSATIGALSGGWKKRVALARAWVADPQVLLLDEPTNHLDIDGIAWLEATLRDFGGAVVCITHDRRFIDAFATRIVELDRGTLRSYPVPFDAYRAQKAQQLEVEAVNAAKADKVLAAEEVWIRKGVEARRTRNAGRVLRLERLRALRAERRERIGRVNLKIDRGETSGRLVAELEDASVQFGDRIVIRDFTSRLMRGDKVGLIGPNGSGKTTLLRLILGELEPTRGVVRRGTNVQVAYYDQMREVLDPEATLRDTISPGSDTVEIGGTKKHVISYLEDFLFDPVRARSPVKTLSGGERNRLLLARLFARPANVLVLDEPTNDLDIDTLELLEELLLEYPGTLFLVSHDRAFLDNVVTQVIAFEGNGELREYPGGYTDWQRAQERMHALRAADERKAAESEARKAAQARRQAAPAAPAPIVPAAPAAGPARKLGFREKQELDALPARIEELESSVARLQAELADPTLYQRDPERARDVAHELKAAEDAVSDAYARWESLEARR